MTDNKIIIITDDGIESENTRNLLRVLRNKGKDAHLFYTNKISAKSNSISLVPIKYDGIPPTTKLNGFPADCLLYNIFNFPDNKPENTTFVFGINEHNHYGYSNYVSSTTSLLSIAKLYGFPAFAITSEIELSDKYLSWFFEHALYFFHNTNQYVSFNINEESFDFNEAEISKSIFDHYELLETSRGPFYLLTFNQKPECSDEKSDIYYQINKKNYMVVIF